ncbi:MAG: zinc ribbon domain-containing protein [Gammaproteobacteria bacterium]
MKPPLPPESQPKLPPAERSRMALGLRAGAVRGKLELQVCRDCGTVLYPPREGCSNCLSVNLDWRPQSGEGELIADTAIHHSHNAYFKERLPWRIGTVKLDAGPVVIAHLHRDCEPPPSKVQVSARIDQAGQAVLVAFPQTGAANLPADPKIEELTRRA